LYTLYVIRYASFFSSLFRQERRFEGNAHIDHGSGVRRTKINEKITLVIDRFWSWKILSRNGCRALSWCLLIYEVFAWDISAWDSILKMNMFCDAGKISNNPWKRKYRLQSKNHKRKKMYKNNSVPCTPGLCTYYILYLFYIKLKQIF